LLPQEPPTALFPLSLTSPFAIDDEGSHTEEENLRKREWDKSLKLDVMIVGSSSRDLSIHRGVESWDKDPPVNPMPLNITVLIMYSKAMKINPSKSKAIRFTRARAQDPINYSLMDTVILQASSCKYLGIILRSDLSWADQVDCTVEKAFR
jgi:hypothetical protein